MTPRVEVRDQNNPHIVSYQEQRIDPFWRYWFQTVVEESDHLFRRLDLDNTKYKPNTPIPTVDQEGCITHHDIRTYPDGVPNEPVVLTQLLSLYKDSPPYEQIAKLAYPLVDLFPYLSQEKSMSIFHEFLFTLAITLARTKIDTNDNIARQILGGAMKKLSISLSDYLEEFLPDGRKKPNNLLLSKHTEIRFISKTGIYYNLGDLTRTWYHELGAIGMVYRNGEDDPVVFYYGSPKAITDDIEILIKDNKHSRVVINTNIAPLVIQQLIDKELFTSQEISELNRSQMARFGLTKTQFIKTDTDGSPLDQGWRSKSWIKLEKEMGYMIRPLCIEDYEQADSLYRENQPTEKHSLTPEALERINYVGIFDRSGRLVSMLGIVAKSRQFDIEGTLYGPIAIIGDGVTAENCRNQGLLTTCMRYILNNFFNPSTGSDKDLTKDQAIIVIDATIDPSYEDPEKSPVMKLCRRLGANEIDRYLWLDI